MAAIAFAPCFGHAKSIAARGRSYRSRLQIDCMRPPSTASETPLT